MKNKKKGFTLVELIVVLAILAILAAMLVPALTGYIDKANEKKIAAVARQYAVAAQATISDAYAVNDDITSISVTNAGVCTVVVTGDDAGKSKGTKWATSFMGLAEYNSGDTITFVVDGNKLKATDSNVVSDGFTATYNGDGFDVAKN